MEIGALREHLGLIYHPVCANKERAIFFMAQPPLLSRRGNLRLTFRPRDARNEKREPWDVTTTSPRAHPSGNVQTPVPRL